MEGKKLKKYKFCLCILKDRESMEIKYQEINETEKKWKKIK